MYKASSKDINRNKSFHPLSAANLGKVERLQAEEKQQEQKREERRQQLLRDQEEARYDELGMLAEEINKNGSSGVVDGEANSQFYFKKQVRNIFEAEDRAEAERKRQTLQQEQNRELRKLESDEDNSDINGKVTNNHHHEKSAPLAAHPLGKFMSKFKKEEDADVVASGANLNHVDTNNNKSDQQGHENASNSHKRGRDGEENTNSQNTANTGYINPSRAAELKKELDLLHKKRLDPLAKVQQYQNYKVAQAARHQQQQQQQQQNNNNCDANGERRSGGGNNAEMQERIRALLDLKKKKN